MPRDTSERRKRRMRLMMSYAPDWIVTVCLAAAFFALDNIHGYWRAFDLNDKSISYPIALKERVPNIALAFIALVAPLVLMPVINLLTVRSWWDFHNASLGVILALALTGSLTQIVKLTVGRPRPDLLARCMPMAGSVNPVFGVVMADVCTQTNLSVLKDGFRSFFSGHASTSFAGLGFLSFYLAGKLHLFDRRGHVGKAWLALTPLTGATLVAISRTMDYRHHWHDVLVGAIVGILLAFFSYRQYFPALHSPMSHRPYAPRLAPAEQRTSTLPLHNAEGSAPPNANDNLVTDVDDDPDIGGTVPREDCGPLEGVWHEGEKGNGKNVFVSRAAAVR